jgi:hypothetical protein
LLEQVEKELLKFSPVEIAEENIWLSMENCW